VIQARSVLTNQGTPPRRRTDIQAAIGVALIAGGIGLLVTRNVWDSYDASIMGQVATGLVDHHSITVSLDPYHLNSPHSFYGIGMSLAMIPTIILAKLLGRPEIAGEMWTNAWLLAVLVALVYMWARLRPAPPRAAVVTASAVGLGGGLLAYASTGMAEVALAVTIAGGMLGIAGVSRRRGWAPWLVGAAAGGSVLVRDDSSLLVVPWLVAGALLASPERRQALVRIVIGGLPFLAVFLWYDDARFGSPWKVGYQGVATFHHSFFAGLYGLLISPGKGLVFFAPLILVAAAGVGRAWNHDRAQVLAAVALLASRVLFYAGYWGWYGGGNYGPRYVLAATPVLAVGVVEVVIRWTSYRSPLRVAAAACAALSVGIGFVGGAVRYERGSLDQALSARQDIRPPTTTGPAYLASLESKHTQAVVDHYTFDWSLFPPTNEASLLVHRRDLAAAALSRPADKPRAALAALLFVAGLAATGVALGVSRRRPTI
jgi:hypothetical protein